MLHSILVNIALSCEGADPNFLDNHRKIPKSDWRFSPPYYTGLQKKNIEMRYRQKWLFSMFFGMENPFLASVFTHMIWIFLYRKWPFSLCNRKPKNYFPEKISHSLDFDHFLCFFGRWIRFWHPFLPITSRYCCTEYGHSSIYWKMATSGTAKSRRDG